MAELETTASDESTNLSNEYGSNQQSHDGIVNFAEDLLKEMFPQAPQQEEPTPQPQPSEAEEEEIPVEETNEDELEAESEGLNEDEHEEEVPLYTFDDLKDGVIRMKVGGELRDMSIAQISAELGQVKASSKSQQELKEQLSELEAREQELDRRQVLANQEDFAAAERNKLERVGEHLNTLEHHLDQAYRNNDQNAASQLSFEIRKYERLQNELTESVKTAYAETEANTVQEQIKKLDSLGYGDLLKNREKFEQINDYISKSLSPKVQQMAGYDATLLATIEKARLYDAAQSRIQKPKASGKKVLKSGNGKTVSSKKPQTADDFFLAMGKDIMKGVK